MPFALPFIPVAVSEVLIPALGVVATVILGWYLSRPHGKVSWSGIVSWVETQVKAPIEWVFKGIKERFWDIARCFHNLYWGVRYYVDTARRFVINTKDYLKDYVWDAIHYMAEKFTSWIRRNVSTIWNSLKDLRDFVHYIRYTLITSLFEELTKQIVSLSNTFDILKEWVTDKVKELTDSISLIKTGFVSFATAIAEGIFQDVIPDLRDIIKDFVRKAAKVTGISALLSYIGTWISSLFDEIAKPLKPDIDFLEKLDLDWLLIAYLIKTKPVLIDKADEILNLLMESFNTVKKSA